MRGKTLAKLSPPRVFDAVPRERLFVVLDSALQRAMTMVAAPPGAGKTTLLASYLHARRLPALWYHVDAGDVDPATFFFFMRQAAARMTPKHAALPLFTPEYAADIEGFSRRFFRALFARLPDRTVVALDNVHSVGTESLLHTILTTAATQVPEGVALISLSRSEPPPAYAHLLASDLAVRVDGDALLLTEDETRTLVTRKHGLPMEAAAALFQRTRGWAAGVTLLAQHWRAKRPSSDPQDSVTIQSVADYFSTEIMHALSAEERRVLMWTALLPTVTAALAITLTGSEQAPMVLEKLHRRRLFIARQASSEPRYRFHDLFREFLSQSLRTFLSEARWHDALVQAARLAVQADDAEAAMPLLLEARDVEAASRIVYAQARKLLAAGRFRTLRDWIERLGRDSVESKPWLRFWHGHALMPTDIPSARSAFERAFEHFATTSDRPGQVLAAAQVINSYYYEYVDYAPMAAWVAKIDSLMLDGSAFLDPASDADICTSLIFGATWLGHANDRVFTARAEALLLDPALEVNLKVSLGYALSDFYTVGSRMSDARRVMDRLLPLLDDPSVTALNRAYAHLQFGYHLLRSGEYAAAERAWQAVDRIAEEHGLHQTEFVARIFRSFLRSCQRDIAGAEGLLRGLELEATDAQPLSGALFHIAGVLLELAREDGPAAARHARLSLRHVTRLGGGFVNVAWRAHGSAALAMAGEHEDAQRWIDEGLAQARGSWLECYRTNLLMSRAYSFLLQGEQDRAHAVIGELLRVARANDWWTYLRIVPNVKDVVIREAIRAGVELPFAQKLARNLRARPGEDPPNDWPWPVKVHTLGEFRVLIDGSPLTFGRKAQKRPLSLLKVLIALGGRGVGVEHLAALLWAESEADDADDALTMAAHRLRKLFGEESALTIRDGKISLDHDSVWVDAWALERVLSRIEGETERARSLNLDADLHELQRLYRGHFLERDAEEAWILPMQQRLRGRVQRAFVKAGQRLEAEQRWDAGAALYERGIELDPLAEDMYRRLMLCHRARGRLTEASEVYRRCRHMLSVMLGAQPSRETRSVYESLSADY